MVRARAVSGCQPLRNRAPENTPRTRESYLLGDQGEADCDNGQKIESQAGITRIEASSRAPAVAT